MRMRQLDPAGRSKSSQAAHVDELAAADRVVLDAAAVAAIAAAFPARAVARPANDMSHHHAA